MYKLILLDLDGTLLRSDKTISEYSIKTLDVCRQKGMMIGFSTARGESNAKQFIKQVKPEIIISSGGALVTYKENIIYTCMFSESETKTLIKTALSVTDNESEITVDTLNGHYWNYKINPNFSDWGEIIHTNFADFCESSLKICIQINDYSKAQKIAKSVENCTFTRFSDVDWYKYSKQGASKESAIEAIEKTLSILSNDIIAFGDDYVDLEMLKCCGKGIAMGNAIEEVKAAADDVTENNDNDGVAKYLEKWIL